MKQLHFSIMLSILLSMFAVQSYAHDIVVKNADGIPIYYKWKNAKKELSVSFRGDKYNSYSYEYQGDVVIPEYVIYGGVKYPVTSISGRAFYDCSSLISITIPNGVTSIDEQAFSYCKALTSLILPNGVTSIGESAFADCTGLTSVVIPNSVTSIDVCAFYNCPSLTSLIIPNSVISIGRHAFSDCTGLTSVVIPKAVASIGGGVFSGCSNLTTLKVDERNRIYDSRDNCNAIIKTSTNTLIAACQATTSIPNSVKAIGEDAFSGYTSLTSITIPSGVTSIGERAFYGCTGLKSVTIPNSVRFIDVQAFFNCTSLTTITIPKGVTSIAESTFSLCSSLTTVIIPNSVLSIGKWAFQNCTGLTSVTIGNSVMAIDYGVFQDCKKLKEVICLTENVPTTNLYAFFVTPIQNATLKVAESSIDLYKSQKPWSDFGKIVVYSPDNEAANSVIAMIKAIGKVVYTDVSKARIDAARTAYEALTDVQKALVTNVETLVAAEAKYLELQKMATGINVVSADDVENIWYDLGGRKLCKKPVTKGVYILNGKTVFIK